MRDILIKGMDMPECCEVCPCYDWVEDICRITESPNDFSDERIWDCPLVEVPTPHGRLIDADELFNEIRANSYHLERRFQKNIGMFLDDIYLKIAEVHTIVEAEE